MNYYDEIKSKLINNEILQRVKDYSKNKSDLNTYYEVGKLLVDAGKHYGEGKLLVDAGKHYGEGIIKQYSIKLTNELGRKYSYRTLNYMVKYYKLQKIQPVAANLSWSNWIELLSIKDINKINYYINLCLKYNLSKRQLREKIKLKEYERLPSDTKNKLINKEDVNVIDFVKNPIVIKNRYNTEEISEKMLKQ